LNQN